MSSSPALEIDPEVFLYTAGVALVVCCAVLFLSHRFAPKGQE